ncbi:MAG TPA: hypothetical protein VMZ52_09110 [Bryobacteraceae bacterium]|nr:hypothetical protein [Bryobacteraceae bacterium]
MQLRTRQLGAAFATLQMRFETAALLQGKTPITVGSKIPVYEAAGNTRIRSSLLPSLTIHRLFTVSFHRAG